MQDRFDGKAAYMQMHVICEVCNLVVFLIKLSRKQLITVLESTIGVTGLLCTPWIANQ